MKKHPELSANFIAVKWSILPKKIDQLKMKLFTLAWRMRINFEGHFKIINYKSAFNWWSMNVDYYKKYNP